MSNRASYQHHPALRLGARKTSFKQEAIVKIDQALIAVDLLCRQTMCESDQKIVLEAVSKLTSARRYLRMTITSK